MAGKPSRRGLVLGGVLGSAGVAAAIASQWNRIPRGFVEQYFREMKRPIQAAPAMPDPRSWPDKGLYATWIGHTTVLLKLDGFTVLTDPVFGARAGLNFGPLTLGIKRLVAPAVDLRQLPHVNLILLSHAHMDHFDVPTLRSLESKKTAVVTATATSDLLRVSRYASVQELSWGGATRIGPASVRGLEVNHWGARMRTDTWRGYNGYFLECGRWRVLFAGDTANTPAFRDAPKGAHLALMPIGAYNPWVRYHCTPEDAWRMGNEARAEHFLPVHHQTFQLSREPYFEPIERFHGAAGSQGSRIVLGEIGGEFRLT